VAATAATGTLSHRRATTGNPYPAWKRLGRVLLGVALGLVATVGWLGWTTPVTPTVPLPGLRHAFGGVLVAELLVLLVLCSLVELRLGGSILLAGFLLFHALEWDQPRPLWWPWMLLAVAAAAVALAIHARRAAGDHPGMAGRAGQLAQADRDRAGGDPLPDGRLGQTQQGTAVRHSFDYLDDAEDPRFASHVARIIRHLRIRQPPSDQCPSASRARPP
jgi:hypothetical protein